MRATRRAIVQAAAVAFPVLIEGESGSGKELVARAIHRRSARRDRPLRAINCAALPDDLVEAELFGVVKGAFTGALADRPGVFEEAHGGTLFLDEVGELTPRAQAKLLRTIQEGEVRRVGEARARRVDVRLIAATNRDLRREVDAGRFRMDLWYRLDVLRISVPPLRARRDDIPSLVLHLWMRVAAQAGSRAVLTDAVLAVFEQYDWPGNVRELENVVARALALNRSGVVVPEDLPDAVRGLPVGLAAPGARERPTLAEVERRYAATVLAEADGNKTRAAEVLGIDRKTLYRILGEGEDDR
jgi:transcriptional regulator with PAS, ATPase and Fis domain